MHTKREVKKEIYKCDICGKILGYPNGIYVLEAPKSNDLSMCGNCAILARKEAKKLTQ